MRDLEILYHVHSSLAWHSWIQFTYTQHVLFLCISVLSLYLFHFLKGGIFFWCFLNKIQCFPSWQCVLTRRTNIFHWLRRLKVGLMLSVLFLEYCQLTFLEKSTGCMCLAFSTFILRIPLFSSMLDRHSHNWWRVQTVNTFRV